ncbi:unnamed protein product [Leptosia nina]|uniref:Invertebrate defensins family profile domain-containing protein n=1 Tax=Leptosia nina TaxID=320188 RepID=A0AAV1JSA7_9NEOP
MNVVGIAVLLAAFVCLTQASPIEEPEVEAPAAFLQDEYVDPMESMEMLNGSRQRICTAALCHNVCRSLGWRTGSCNSQLLCICRR